MKKPHLIFQLDRIFCSVWLRLRLRLLRATDTRHFKWFTPTDIKSQHRSKLVPVQWSDQILSAVCWSGTFDNTPPNSRNYNSENTNGEFVFFGTFDKIFIFQQYSYVYVRTTINQKEIWRLKLCFIAILCWLFDEIPSLDCDKADRTEPRWEMRNFAVRFQEDPSMLEPCQVESEILLFYTFTQS